MWIYAHKQHSRIYRRFVCDHVAHHIDAVRGPYGALALAARSELLLLARAATISRSSITLLATWQLSWCVLMIGDSSAVALRRASGRFRYSTVEIENAFYRHFPCRNPHALGRFLECDHLRIEDIRVIVMRSCKIACIS